MTTYIVLDGKKQEVLDKEATFTEGDKIILEKDGVKNSYSIMNVIKVLREISGKYDVVTEVILT